MGHHRLISAILVAMSFTPVVPAMVCSHLLTPRFYPFGLHLASSRLDARSCHRRLYCLLELFQPPFFITILTFVMLNSLPL